MTRVLHRISRNACPAADRPWLDALFAEIDAIESGRARLLWLLGAFGLVTSRYVRRILMIVTPSWLACFVAALGFSWLGIIEYEALAIEDDWYPALATSSFAALLGISILNLRRRTPDTWP